MTVWTRLLIPVAGSFDRGTEPLVPCSS